MKIIRVPISQVDVWEKNPKNIKKKNLERLKKQIQELGVYKPLICVQENGKYIALGGNMRLRALRALNHTKVDISIVPAETEAQKIKYALSDNDKAGEYNEQQLAELVHPHIEEIDLGDYNINLGESVDLDKMLENFMPGEAGEQARLDKLAKKVQVKCPECGLEFIP